MPAHLRTDELSEAADAFWGDGACVVRGVLSPADVDRARLAVDGLADGDDLADLSALAGASEPPRFRAGVDHWRTHDAFLALATSGALPAVAAAILRTERLWLYEDSVLVKEPGSTVATRWHTDDGYFHVDGDQLATLWVPLDPAPREAGSLRFLRGSHLAGRRYRPTLFVVDDAIPGAEGEPPPQPDLDDTDAFGFDLLPGDLTVHHARTLHASGGNRTGQARRALSVRYCGDDAVVRVKPGVPGKPGLDGIAAGTPLVEVAELLGLPEATPDR
ncbi:MAG: phytanoyl-CoA dioxygenase family protein [Acidimicrobiales bacterium]